MLASDNTVLPSISQSKEANHGPSGDITSISIARVKVKVMLTPTNVQYSHSVHFRAPWPTISQTSSYLPPFIKFSFPRLKTTSDVEVVDIYIGERRARWEWDGYWIKVWLVDGGGVLDVVYSVPVRDGEDKEKLDAVLPVFAVAISRLKMKVDVPTGYTLLPTTNLQMHTSSPAIKLTSCLTPPLFQALLTVSLTPIKPPPRQLQLHYIWILFITAIFLSSIFNSRVQQDRLSDTIQKRLDAIEECIAQLSAQLSDLSYT